MMHGHALRLGRLSLPRQAYLVTACTRERRPLLAQFGAARAVINALRAAQDSGCATSLAFVVMPDHLHWLLTLESGTLAQLIKQVRGCSAHGVNRCWKRHGPVWQPGFHDHALRREESLVNVARYIIMNPVRAGLVRSPGNWPHWDCCWLDGPG